MKKKLVLLAAAVAALPVVSAPAVDAAFPGENGRILFLSEEGGSDADIFTMKPDGTGIQQVTDNNKFESYSCWSPNGNRIAFTKQDNDEGDSEVYTMKPDGTGVRRLTDNPQNDFDPCWSPNGEKIIYSSPRGEENQYAYIFKINSDGTGDPDRVSPLKSNHSSPVWGTGGLIAVEGWDGEDNEIQTMKPNGTDIETLTENKITDFTPDWAPNGERLTFVRIFSFDTKDENYDVFTMKANGGDKFNVTDTPEKNEGRPAWSPNGQRIVFNLDLPESSDLVTIRTDGTGRRNLTQDYDFASYWADWQAN